jgi:hypothetical protein
MLLPSSSYKTFLEMETSISSNILDACVPDYTASRPKCQSCSWFRVLWHSALRYKYALLGRQNVGVESHSSTEYWNGGENKKEVHRKRDDNEGNAKREENKAHRNAQTRNMGNQSEIKHGQYRRGACGINEAGADRASRRLRATDGLTSGNRHVVTR